MVEKWVVHVSHHLSRSDCRYLSRLLTSRNGLDVFVVPVMDGPRPRVGRGLRLARPATCMDRWERKRGRDAGARVRETDQANRLASKQPGQTSTTDQMTAIIFLVDTGGRFAVLRNIQSPGQIFRERLAKFGEALPYGRVVVLSPSKRGAASEEGRSTNQPHILPQWNKKPIVILVKEFVRRWQRYIVAESG